MKKKYLSFQKVKQNLVDINSKINQTNWKPDIILSVNRGGCVPGVFLSHMRDLNHEVLSFKNIININNDIIKKIMNNHSSILIIDDINDTGKTFRWIQQDWQSGCFSGHQHWNNVWGNNVRTAALIDNGASEFGEVDYTALEINKAEKDVWVVFPWEGERNYGNI